MSTDGRIKARLAVMMVLVYSVQGAFWPLLSIHLVDLGVPERARGWIFATFAIGSVAMSMGAGRVADRLLPTQKCLSWTYAGGSVLLTLIALGLSSDVGWLLGLFLVYSLVMAPNYTLSSSLAFRNLDCPDREFGRVRLWGTVGWMAVGWLISARMGWAGHRSGRGVPEAFGIAAGLSALTAIYCRTLPDTPPLAKGGRRGSSLGEVVELVRRPGMAAYLVAAFGVSLTVPFVYQVLPNTLRAGGMDRAWVPSAMSLGQWPEIVGLAALPWLIRRGGYRLTLVVGMAAYAVRFGSLVAGPPLWLATAGIPLHGLGVACFSIGGQMFVDRQAPADRRAGAQSINTMVSGGLGSLLGSLLGGEIVGAFPDGSGLVFALPCAINAGLVVFVWSRFRPTPNPAPSPDRVERRLVDPLDRKAPAGAGAGPA